MRILLILLIVWPVLAATNRTVTVKPTGGDYTSLAAAVAGESKNLVALDRQLTIECYAMADTAAVLFDRTVWTTDATRNILVTVPASERHAGVYSTSKYRLEVSSTHPIQIHHGVHITVEWIQVYLTGSPGSNWRVIYLGGATNSASNITIRNCIVRTGNGFNWQGGIHASYTGNSGTNVYIYNNLIYVGTGTQAWGIWTDIPGNYFIWNNTVVASYGGLNLNNGGKFKAVNNILNVTTTAARGYASYEAGTGYNATDRSGMGYTVTGGATGDRVSQTFTFVNAGASDYHLDATDGGARGFGVTDPGSGAFSNDIDGETRSGAWDIGADEFPSAVRRRNIVTAKLEGYAAAGGRTVQKEWK